MAVKIFTQHTYHVKFDIGDRIYIKNNDSNIGKIIKVIMTIIILMLRMVMNTIMI